MLVVLSSARLINYQMPKEWVTSFMDPAPEARDLRAGGIDGAVVAEGSAKNEQPTAPRA